MKSKMWPIRVNAGSGQTNAANGHSNAANGQGKVWWLPAWGYNPWSDDATISFVRKVAGSSIIALNTLLTLFVMYLWAWAKPGSPYIPNLFQSTKDSEGHAKDSKGPASSLVQALISLLPFIVFPITVSASGMANALESDRGHLGTVAAFCLGKLIAAVILGAGMLICVTGWSTTYVGLGATVFAILLVLAWSLYFNHPKCLRTFIWSTCFRQAQAAEVSAGPAEVPGGEAGP
ncbi:hypothetical protein C2845_PM01G25710 [Panicum miliaceum]|uniref:Uncharacterized protein n=1 Tax=Panicum miliaceum TaxID=4540 RepID=A0A3L6TM58_PANMI|nr:hypothetical protein C2845_PM01G25710 [Panicum miliaceum]